MRVGYIQFEPRLGEAEENLQEMRTRVSKAPPADLLVLPELCNSGYNFTSRDQATALAEPTDGKFVQALQELASDRDVTLVSGLCERAEDTNYNSAVLVRPDGSVETYRKLHLFWNEPDYFAPGNLGLPVFSVGDAKVGLLICFDWQFPEAWRVLALRGADVVCHPSNLVLPGLAQRSIPVHALLNRLHVVTANRIGNEGELHYTGRSTIINARGETLSEAAAEAPAVDVRELSLEMARDKKVTPRNDLLGDRRTEFYGDLI